MKKYICSVSLAIVLFSATAQAITDREDILRWCQGSSTVAAGRCTGFLLAAEDALKLGPVEGISACIPVDVSLKELYAAILNWLPEHPEAEASTGLGLAAQALAVAFPCKP